MEMNEMEILSDELLAEASGGRALGTEMPAGVSGGTDSFLRSCRKIGGQYCYECTLRKKGLGTGSCGQMIRGTDADAFLSDVITHLRSHGEEYYEHTWPWSSEALD